MAARLVVVVAILAMWLYSATSARACPPFEGPRLVTSSRERPYLPRAPRLFIDNPTGVPVPTIRVNGREAAVTFIPIGGSDWDSLAYVDLDVGAGTIEVDWHDERVDRLVIRGGGPRATTRSVRVDGQRVTLDSDAEVLRLDDGHEVSHTRNWGRLSLPVDRAMTEVVAMYADRREETILIYIAAVRPFSDAEMKWIRRGLVAALVLLVRLVVEGHRRPRAVDV